MPTYQMKFLAPDLNFGFAWEPDTRQLYIIHGNGKPHEQIAGNVRAPEHAEMLASMWLMGYRSRAREDNRIIGKRHFHMLAEAGAVGMKMNPGG